MILLFATEEAAWAASAKIAQNLGMSGDTLYVDTPVYLEESGKWKLVAPEPQARPLTPYFDEETGKWVFPYEIIDPMVGVVDYEIWIPPF